MTSKLNTLDRQQNSGWQADSLTIDLARMLAVSPFIASDTLCNPSLISLCSMNGYGSIFHWSAIHPLTNESHGIEQQYDRLDVHGGVGDKLPADHRPAFALQWRSAKEFWRKGSPSPILH